MVQSFTRCLCTHHLLCVRAAVGCREGGRAALQVPRRAASSGAADWDGVNAAGVAVSRAVVTSLPAVPRRPHVHGAPPLAALRVSSKARLRQLTYLWCLHVRGRGRDNSLEANTQLQVEHKQHMRTLSFCLAHQMVKNSLKVFWFFRGFLQGGRKKTLKRIRTASMHEVQTHWNWIFAKWKSDQWKLENVGLLMTSHHFFLSFGKHGVSWQSSSANCPMDGHSKAQGRFHWLLSELQDRRVKPLLKSRGVKGGGLFYICKKKTKKKKLASHTFKENHIFNHSFRSEKLSEW